MKKITSNSNELVKKIYKYTKSQTIRGKDSVTILDGLHLIQEVFKAGNPKNLSHVLCTQKSLSSIEFSEFLKNKQINLFLVTDEIMKKISPTKTPQGILGVYNFPKNPQNLDINTKTVTLLDRVSDPGNLGTIIRTGVALGVEAFFLSKGCAQAWSPKVLRASQGAHFYTNIFVDFDLENIKKYFDGEIFGTFLDPQAKSIYNTIFPSKVGFCFGNEGSGINEKEFKKYGKNKIFIPMDKNFESLNVAIASGICLSERKRQIFTKK